MQYNTKQRKLMADYIESHAGEGITAFDVANYLRDSGTPVGMSTVYRFLDKLTREGALAKFYDDSSDSGIYRTVTQECHVHCHFLCTGCGKIFHVDCHHFDGFSDHIMSDHGFKIDLSKTIFSGQCEECLKGGAK